MSMTKVNIVESVYEKLGISKKDCISVVDSLFEIMKDELANGNPVMVSGFGKWGVLSKKARTGRNPQTGAAITIAARKVVTFKVSSALKKGFL